MVYARQHLKQVIDLGWLFLILKIPGKCFTGLKDGFSGLVNCMNAVGMLMMLFSLADGSLVDDEIRIYYGSADTSVSMASAKVRDILEYIHGCPEEQCPEEYCRWFEEDTELPLIPNKGSLKLR